GLPSVCRGLLQPDLLAVRQRGAGLASDVEIDPQPVRGLDVNVPSDGWEKASRCGRTTRDLEPWLTLEFCVASQRRGVTKSVAFQRDASQNRVVKRLLEQVDVASVARQLEHPIIPQHHPCRGACFLISIVVGKVVVVGEALI